MALARGWQGECNLVRSGSDSTRRVGSVFWEAFANQRRQRRE